MAIWPLATSEIQDAAQDSCLCGWVPLAVQDTQTIGDVMQRAATTVDAAQKLGGFPEDLLQRDPQITQRDTPLIGLALDQANPIVGTQITVSVQNAHIDLHVGRRSV